MEHTLPALPYAMDALAPTISQETLKENKNKHHKANDDNLKHPIKVEKFETSTL